MSTRSNVLRWATFGLLLARSPRWVPTMVGFAILGATIAVALIVLSVAARSEPQAADNPYNMKLFLSHDNDQKVLHENCPNLPADAILVACTFVVDNAKRGGPDCYILLATDQIIARYGGELAHGANLLAGTLSDCIKSLESPKRGAAITELPAEIRGKWCIDTTYPTGGTVYKPCGSKKPDVSLSDKLVVTRSGQCAFNSGRIAGPQYLIEIACPRGNNLTYWMVRDNERLLVKPFRREDLPSGAH